MIGFTPLPFDEAIAFFRNKIPLTPAMFRQLTTDAKTKAFTVADTARMDVITDLYGAIDRAIADGTTIADFKKSVQGIMARRGWDGLAPYRVDTIYRTNIQQAYQAGHYAQLKEVSGRRPYWQYVAVMDGRTRPAHARMNGKVFRHDDPFWATSYPPNGFNCRCTVRSLSDDEMDREGLALSNISTGGIADPGFDRAPDISFQPDLDRYRHDIARRYIEDAIMGPDFARFFAGDVKGTRPVAVLDADMRQLINAESQTVLLSDTTLIKNKSAHKELGIADYQRLPAVIDTAQLVVQDGDQVLVFVRRDSEFYHAVIKSTGSGKALFLTSYRITNMADVQRIMKKGRVIRNEL